MTGEITLTGLVLPVGGIKEKVLAGHRAGIRRIILPDRNRNEIKDVPEDVRAELELIFVDRIEAVWAAAIPDLAARMETTRPGQRAAAARSASA
jgi:ATP-dependent Lon protease